MDVLVAAPEEGGDDCPIFGAVVWLLTESVSGARVVGGVVVDGDVADIWPGPLSPGRGFSLEGDLAEQLVVKVRTTRSANDARRGR